MYDSPEVTAIKHASRRVVWDLFAAYERDISRLADGRRPIGSDETARLRAIGDYVAGMTDRFAISAYEDLVGPADMPSGF